MALSSYLLAGSRAASPSFPSLRRRSHHFPPSLLTTPLPPAQRWRRSLRFCAASSPPPPVPPEDEELTDYDYEVPNLTDMVVTYFSIRLWNRASAVSSSFRGNLQTAHLRVKAFSSLILYLNELVCNVAGLLPTREKNPCRIAS
jgi:hypothetical protein